MMLRCSMHEDSKPRGKAASPPRLFPGLADERGRWILPNDGSTQYPWITLKSSRSWVSFSFGTWEFPKPPPHRVSEQDENCRYETLIHTGVLQSEKLRESSNHQGWKPESPSQHKPRISEMLCEASPHPPAGCGHCSEGLFLKPKC